MRSKYQLHDQLPWLTSIHFDPQTSCNWGSRGNENWGNGKKARSFHFTDILLLWFLHVMRKSMSIHVFMTRLSIPYNWHQWDMCKVFASRSVYVLHFWELVSFLEVVESASGLFILCSNFLRKLMLKLLQFLALLGIHVYFSHTTLLFTTTCLIQWIYNTSS